MKTLLQSSLVLLALSSSPALLSCKAKTALSIRDNVTAVPLREFELALGEEQDLKSNRLFLFPENMTAADFARISAAAREYELLEAEVFPLKVKLKRHQDEKLTEILAYEDLLGRIQGFQTRIEGKQRNIATEEAKPEGERSQANLDRWRREIATLQTNIDALTPERQSAETFLADYLEVRARDNDVSRRSFSSLETLKSSVDWFGTPPESVILRQVETLAEDGTPQTQLQVKLVGWLENDAHEPRTFDTQDGTIRNAKFSRRGGRAEFEVLIYSPDDVQKETLLRSYKFDLRRARYAGTDDPADGRIYYSGEMNLFDPSGVELRKGIAKLTDKANP